MIRIDAAGDVPDNREITQKFSVHHRQAGGVAAGNNAPSGALHRGGKIPAGKWQIRDVEKLACCLQQTMMSRHLDDNGDS